MLRVLSFLQHRPTDHCWAHPIDGVVAYVDLIEARGRRADRPRACCRCRPRRATSTTRRTSARPRTTLSRIEITQPEGPSFTVDGDVVTWEDWTFRVGFDPREGLVLHQIAFDGDGAADHLPGLGRRDGGALRRPEPGPVLAELLRRRRVPARPAGQLAGSWAATASARSTTSTPCSPTTTASRGRCATRSACTRRTSACSGSTPTCSPSRARPAASAAWSISFFATVGNYDYGFYWYLYLDGTIQLEVKATGVVFTAAYVEGGTDWATEVAPGLGAPYHQHLFSARLDMMVDGVRNAVDEVDVRAGAGRAGQPVRQRVRPRRSPGSTPESRGRPRAADALGRRGPGRIVNPERANRLGQPVGYVLLPQGQPTLLADAGLVDPRAGRRSRPSTCGSPGTTPRSATRPATSSTSTPAAPGLPAWIAADRSIDGEDIVLWHTFGVHALPAARGLAGDAGRLRCGFTLKPVGFFDRNPTLDVPARADGTSCHAG